MIVAVLQILLLIPVVIIMLVGIGAAVCYAADHVRDTIKKEKWR
jgi:ABC-type polysaccharide/polyol phosphate export permease